MAKSGRSLRRAHALAAFSGVLYFASFPSFDLWPLAFVCLVPLWLGLHLCDRPRDALLVGLTCGLVTNLGGYAWLAGTLKRFSGLPLAVCYLLTVAVCLYQGGQLGLFAWLTQRVRARGHDAVLLAPLLFVACEHFYPLLFPSYLANALHSVPVWMQIVDLGGPLLLSAVVVAVNAALYAAMRWAQSRSGRPPAAALVGPVLALATLAYGHYRLGQVERAMARAPTLDVGLVQANLGLLEKRKDFEEALRRHVALTRKLLTSRELDLVVWPESAVPITLPDRPTDLAGLLGRPGVPLLFGGLTSRSEGERRRLYNAALLAGPDGWTRATYAKMLLLPFGEYLPFGDALPVLYDLSPQSGRFSPGESLAPLRLDGTRLSALICYEDIFAGLVRRAVAASAPHLLVNLTNDAWFGDTSAPWLHLALAKFRAVEHHRSLVRATNSGVSAIVDPTGRLVAQAPLFEQTTLSGQVPLLDQPTLYTHVGDALGWLCLASSVLCAVVRRRAAPSA